MIPGFLLANVVTEGYMTDVGPFGIDVVVQTYWMLEMMGGPFVSESLEGGINWRPSVNLV
jgi:hypothetical protein